MINKILILILSLSILTGCGSLPDNLVNNITDERASLGCYVTGIDFNSYFSTTSVHQCKLFCSKILPPGFEYIVDLPGCKISVKTPITLVPILPYNKGI